MSHVAKEVHITASKYVRMQYLDFIKDFENGIVSDEILKSELHKRIFDPEINNKIIKYCCDIIAKNEGDREIVTRFVNILLLNKLNVFNQIMMEVSFHQKGLKKTLV